MNKKIVKQTVAAALLTSSILSFATVSYGKEMTIQQSIDAVKLEMKKAPLSYVNPAINRVIEPSKDLYPVLNKVKKQYKEITQQIQSSNLSAKEKKNKIRELDALYEEKITKGLIPYIDAYNYADKYLDPILKEMLDAHATGDLDGVEQAYHKLSYQLGSRTSILYRFTGKAARDLLLEKYKKPSDAKRDELRIPVTIYMKNNEVLRLWNEGKKEEARKVMDEVLSLAAKTSNDGVTNYSKLLSKEVQEAEALFANTPTPVVPSNPSVNGGNGGTSSESSAERKLRIAKTNAITELADYKNLVKNDYSPENWTTIETLITTWTSTINGATTPAAVTQALTDAKAAIDEVKTIEQEALDAAKAQALEGLTDYKKLVKIDYSPENWTAIETLIETWTSTIDNALTQTEVAQALINAKAAIDEVKTIEEEALDAAKTQARGELADYKEAVKGNYSTANWSIILSLKTTWTSTIDDALTQTEVAQALINAKAAIDEVKTIEEEALDAAKAQALEGLTDYKILVKNDYSPENWTAIETLIETWTSTIDDALTQTEVAQALINAKAMIDEVKTIEQEALDAAKTQARGELTDYKILVKNDYSPENWTAIETLIETWTSTIDDALTQTEVAQALINAKAMIDEVKTIEQEALDAAKTQARGELADYKILVKNDYSPENWTAIETLIETWTSTIDSATTPAAVNQALNNAKVAIDEVNTIEQEALDAAKRQALAGLTNYKEDVKDDYSTVNWEAIQTSKTAWTIKINSATTPALANQALIDAKAEIDRVEVKSNVSTINGIAVNNVLALVDSSDLYVYNVTLPSGTVLAELTKSDIITMPTNLGASITTTTIDQGSTWKIVVTSEDGKNTETYRLNITITPQ